MQTQTNLSAAADPGVVASLFERPSRRILVVEDDEIIRAIVAHAITQAGYDVDTAENGEQGWAALKAREYDLLITDNNMPCLTGLELVQMLRSASMTLPVILASGGTSRVDPSLRITATLPKPFFTDQLLKVVQEVLHATADEMRYCDFFTATLANLRCANKV